MENASKALLIAGAVLIAILLISVGIKTFNSTQGMADQVDTTVDTTATSTFNAQFLSYLSNSTSAANARALVSKVLAHNARVSTGSDFSAENHQIYLNLYKGPVKESGHDTDKGGHNYTSGELQDVYNKISDTKKYKITVTPGCSYPGGYYKGYVICLSIFPIT